MVDATGDRRSVAAVESPGVVVPPAPTAPLSDDVTHPFTVGRAGLTVGRAGRAFGAFTSRMSRSGLASASESFWHIRCSWQRCRGERLRLQRLPVVDGDDILQGLVTRIDLFKLYLEPHRRPQASGPAATVAQIMSRGVIVLRPEERVFTAIALMVEHHVVTIPVVTPTPAGPRVVGVITRRDAAGALKP